MKKIVAITLLLGVLLQMLSKLVIIGDYQLNKSYIAENLCENKSKPQMHCEGKCHLKKQLEKEDKRENPVPSQNTKENEVQFFSALESLNFATSLTGTSSYSNYFYSIATAHPGSIFHPPDNC